MYRLYLSMALLFSLIAGSMSWASESNRSTLSGVIEAVLADDRELVIRSGPDSRGTMMTVHVRLKWDEGEQKSFASLLPPCVVIGGTICASGTYEQESGIFLADRIGGCSARAYRDRTGVRFRLNKMRAEWAAP